MNQIRDLVKKYDLYLFSDEVYREYIYTGSPYISACHLEGIEQNVILIDSVSKRYSECGIRIGALVTKNEAVKAAVMKLCPVQILTPICTFAIKFPTLLECLQLLAYCLQLFLTNHIICL